MRRAGTFPATGDRVAQGNGNGVVGRIADLGNDVFTLAELQARLAALDLKECTERATLPLSAVVVGTAVLLAAVPVALLGVADLVAYALNIRPGWAMLLTAALASAFAGLFLFVFGRQLADCLTTFRRSREELSRNLAWVRTVLLYSGRPAPKREH